jgi:hypothetical protein
MPPKKRTKAAKSVDSEKMPESSVIVPNSREPSGRVRKSKFENNEDYIYDIPTPKKSKKTEDSTVPEKAKEKEAAKAKKRDKKPAEPEDEKIDAKFLEPFKFGWKREVVSRLFWILLSFSCG